MTINRQLWLFKRFVEGLNNESEASESRTIPLPIKGAHLGLLLPPLELSVRPERRSQRSTQSASSAPPTEMTLISTTDHIDNIVNLQVARIFQFNEIQAANMLVLQKKRYDILAIVAQLLKEVGDGIIEIATDLVWTFRNGHIYYTENGVEIIPIINNAGIAEFCDAIHFLVIENNNNIDAETMERLRSCFQRATLKVEELSIDYPEDPIDRATYLLHFDLNQSNKFQELNLVEISNYVSSDSIPLILNFPNGGISLHFFKCDMENIDLGRLSNYDRVRNTISYDKIDRIKIDALDMYPNDEDSARKITELMKQFASVKTQIWKNLPSDIDFEPEFVLSRERTFIQIGDRYVHYITSSRTLETNDLTLTKAFLIKDRTKFNNIFIDGSRSGTSPELMKEVYNQIRQNPVECLEIKTSDTDLYQIMSGDVPTDTFKQLEISLESPPSYSCSDRRHHNGIYLKTDDIGIFLRQNQYFCLVVTLKNGLSNEDLTTFITHLKDSHKRNPIWFLQLHTDCPNIIREGIETTVKHGLRLYNENIFELLSMEPRRRRFTSESRVPRTRRVEVIVKDDGMIEKLDLLPKDRESYRYDFQHDMKADFWKKFALHISNCGLMKQIEFAGRLSSFSEYLGSLENPFAKMNKLEFIRIEIDSIENRGDLLSMTAFPVKYFMLVDTTQKSVTNEDVAGFVSALCNFTTQPWKQCKLRDPVQGVYILAKEAENETPNFNFDDQGSFQYQYDKLMTTKRGTIKSLIR